MKTKGTMLIAEDSLINRKFLRDTFAQEYETLEAEDGEEALTLLETYGTKITIIILDMVMPNKSGMEVLEEIKNKEELRTIPIIAFTSREEFQLKALQNGAWDYIMKSSSIEIVKARVENVLAKKKLIIREQKNKELEEQVTYDYLTGLLNRKAFENQINLFFTDNVHTRGAFLMIDIMNHKKIDDYYGHEEGDEVICIAANLLRKEFGRNSMIGRIGGEEFAVFLPEIDCIEKIQVTLARFCQKSHLKFNDYNGEVEVYCCAGVAFSPEDGTAFHLLYHNADKALLHAKCSKDRTFAVHEKEMKIPSYTITQDMEWLLDEATDGIYVSDAETHEILYKNTAVGKLIGKEGNIKSETKCYEYLMNKESPCSFCKMHLMKSDDFLEREFHMEGVDRHFILKGKQIEWAGRKAHIEYLIDNTKQALLSKKMKNQLKKEELLVECTKYLSGIYWIEEAMRSVLEALGVYYKAENCFVLEYEKKTQILTQVYCWKRKSVFTEFLGKAIDLEDLKNKNNTWIFDINEEQQGCVLISNPSDNEKETELIESICYFIKNELAKKQIEKKLRETTQQLQVTLNSLQSGIVKCVNDEFWTIVSANAIFYEMLGYSQAEFMQICHNKMSRIIKEEYWQKNNIEIEKQLKNGNVVELETCFLKKNGEELYAIDRRVLVKETEGKEYWYCTDTDITEQVKIRKEIERRYQNELSYQSGIEQAGMIGSLRVNLTKNKLEECSYGYEFENLLEQQEEGESRINEMFEEKIAPIFIEGNWNFKINNLLAAFENGESKVEAEYQRSLKDGKINWVRTVAKMAKEPNSNDIIAFIYTYNIHKEKIANDIISHAANKVYDLMTYIDTRTKEFVSYVQGKSEPMVLNYENDDLFTIMEEFVPKPNKSSLKEMKEKMSLSKIQKELEEKEDYTFVIQETDEEGKKNYKKMHYSYLDKKSGTIMLVRTDVTDIYEQQQEQKENIQRALEAAQQANKAKTKFLSSMSHDIRTPMNAIIGMAQIAKMQIGEKEKVKDCLEVITYSSNHLLGLINDVLDMSKIENGSITLSANSFSLKQTVEEIHSIMLPEIEKKKQKFTVDVKNIEHDNLLGDPVRLNRIFINLLDNASKFTQTGGKIVFRIAEEKCENPKLATFLFWVEDNGRGIAKENQKTIFEPFVREGMSSINHVEGTGLGLSIVKNMVEAGGGTIKVESEQGKGAKFVVELQIRINVNECGNAWEADKKKEQEEKKISLEGLHILLVEDHPMNIIVAKKLLENVGATVEVAENGKIGVEKFMTSKEKEFAVILMDIQMPVMDGYEATRQIRKSGHLQAETIPIIAMTANVFKEDVEMAKESGMNSHTGKPISLIDIAQAMRENNLI